MLRQAGRTSYWPNMASDIKQIADMCETCQEMKPRNSPEPLKQHSDGDEPVAEDWSWLVWNCRKALISSGRLLQLLLQWKAESAVKTMKSLLRKTHKEGGDPYEAMLEQRNTPRQDTGRSPAEMMFNRRTRSFLPSMSSSPKKSRACESKQGHTNSLWCVPWYSFSYYRCDTFDTTGRASASV